MSAAPGWRTSWPGVVEAIERTAKTMLARLGAPAPELVDSPDAPRWRER